MSRPLRIVLLLMFSLGFAVSHAQWHPAIQHTNVKLGSSDSIDLDTLSLQASFPVVDKPGRGAGVHFGISYHADFWTASDPLTGGWYSNPSYGWSFQPGSPLGSYSVDQVSSRQCNSDPDNPLYEYVSGNRTYTDPLGIRHSFSGTQTYSECQDLNTQDDFGTWQTVDGYSIWNSYVYDPSGNQVAVGSGWNVDSNGNVPFGDSYLHDCSDQYTSGTAYYCDALGKPAIQVANLSFSGGSPTTGTTIVYTYRDTSGHPQTVTVFFNYFNVRTNFGGGKSDFNKANQLLPTSIAYPDGTYSFTYEPTNGYAGYTTGRIASMTLPTGGTISYGYGTQSPSVRDGAIPYLQRTTTRGSANDTTTFTRTLSTPPDQYTVPENATVTVQPPAGNMTTYVFTGSAASGLGNSYLYLPTSVSNGVTSQSICYQFTFTPTVVPADGSCAQSNIGFPIIGRQTTTTLDNSLTGVVTEVFNANGMLTSTSTSDFASSGSPQILSKTTFAYAAMNSIANHVSVKTQYDGSNNVVASAQYSYDEYSLAPAPAGLLNRFPIFGDRGNLTTASVWDNVSNSYISTHSWYDEAGQVVKTQDASENFTTYDHDASDVFVTTVHYPTTVSGASLTNSSTHDPYTGLVTSQTDANQRIARYSYDGSLRGTTTTHDVASGMDGGSVSHSYPSSNQITTTALNGLGGTVEAESFADVYGRPIRTAHKVTSTTGKPWVISDTCYDEDGRVTFKSLPYDAANYTGTQRCSGSGDSYQYDGIDRVQRLTHADGSYRQFTYTGRAVKVVDEGNGSKSTSRVMQTDGLGRVKIVCEESSITLQAGTIAAPSACGTDVDGTSTGFITAYTYDSSAHTTTSVQSGQSRSWTTDSLGRPISETIPEAFAAMPGSAQQGHTAYSYSYVANQGLKVTRTKPQANQASGTALTTTVTQFDQLGRPQTIQYSQNGSSDPDTPDLSFSYDTASGSSSLATNLLGRLVSVQSANGSVFYGYTPEGRVAVKANSRPNGDCTYILQAFGYDLLGNVNSFSARMSSTSGSPSPNIFSVQNDFDPTGAPLDVKAAWGSLSATTLESTIAYSAHGIDSLNLDQLSGSAQLGYDARGRASSFSAHTGGSTLYAYATNWSGNGSLTSSSDSVNGSWSYGYDDFNRLTSAKPGSNPTTTYQYDVWGNRYPTNGGSGGSAIYTYNSHNHRTDATGTYTYDAAGNMLTNGQTTSKFDAEGRVVRVVSGSAHTTYLYGPEGDRVRVGRANGDDVEYVYSSGSVLLTWLNGALQKTQIAGSLGRIGFVDGNNSFHYEFHDWNGSTRYRTNPGGLPSIFTSQPFGETSASSSDNMQTNGLDWDSDAQAGHAGARDYYSNLGIWNSPDPFGGSYDQTNPQSFNRYAYVGNSPVSFTDHSGMARSDDAPEGSVFSSDGPMYGEDFVRDGGDWLEDHSSSSKSLAISWNSCRWCDDQTQYDSIHQQWMDMQHLAGGFFFNRPAGIVYHTAQQQPVTKAPSSPLIRHLGALWRSRHVETKMGGGLEASFDVFHIVDFAIGGTGTRTFGTTDGSTYNASLELTGSVLGSGPSLEGGVKFFPQDGEWRSYFDTQNKLSFGISGYAIVGGSVKMEFGSGEFRNVLTDVFNAIDHFVPDWARVSAKE